MQLAPIFVNWDTAPPAITVATFDQPTSTLSWQVNDPGTPWLALAVDLVDPAGVNPPQTLDLGRVAVSGTAPLTLPPGTWQATLRATNSGNLEATFPLGTFTEPG